MDLLQRYTLIVHELIIEPLPRRPVAAQDGSCAHVGRAKVIS